MVEFIITVHLLIRIFFVCTYGFMPEYALTIGLTIGLVFTVLAAALGWLLLRRERYGKSVKRNHVQQPEGPYYRDASPSSSYVSVENPFSK
jgi:hypothetical protein